MKKLTALLLSIMILAIPAAKAQFRYAPVAGVTVNTLSFSQDLFDVHQVVGAQGGVMGELMFPGIGFGIDFGLLYNLMGARTDMSQRNIWAIDNIGNPRVDIHTLQIPVHLRFKWTRMNGFEDYLAPFAYGGPEFAITLGHGKIKSASGADPYSYSGGDFGLTAGLGVEIFKNWQLSAQYTWGLTYLLEAKQLDNFSADNRQWAVRLAYFF